MNRLPFRRTDLVWLGLLAAAVAAHWLLPEFRADVPTDSYRSGPRGKKAFYLLTGELGYEPSRNFEPLGRYAGLWEGFETDSVLVLLGPARPPTDREWASLADFVEAGGAVLFAARADDPAFAAKPFGVTGRKLDEPLPEKAAVTLSVGESARLKPVWRSGGEIVAPAGETLVSAGGTVQAAAVRHGDGVAVFVATDRPFDNLALTSPDTAVLAVRLLESLGWRPEATFDESLNASGTPKVVALLLDRPLRPLTVQLFVLLAAFGWWGSRRFGPLLPPAVPPRQDIVAHADAVGMLHYKSGDGRQAVRAYLNQLRSELKLGANKGRESRVLEPIARRLGRSADAVRADLLAAETAASGKRPLDRVSAGKLLRRLARLRRASRRT